MSRKRVLNFYPNAKITILEDGSYAVCDGDVILAEEFYLPSASTEAEAWKYALLACKTTQNFNRTHPDRLSLTDFETKSLRIQERKQNAKNNKKDISDEYWFDEYGD